MKTVKDLVEDLKKRAILVCLCVVSLAYLMSLTSHSVWVNIPIAFLIIAMLRSLSGEVQIRWKTPSSSASLRISSERKSRHRHQDNRHIAAKISASVAAGQSVLELWRLGIEAPEVEAALEELTKSVVNEWVTNMWFRNLSSDQEFPEELASVINNVFSELSRRVKHVNLITLLTQDIVDLVSCHLELFRRTQARVGVDTLGILSTEERDENIKQTLAASGELHPALVSADSEHRVLQKLMGGVVALVLKPEVANCKVARALSRELLACAVMRPVMNLLSPSFINNLIENAALQSQNRPPPPPPPESSKAAAAKRTPDRFPTNKEPPGGGLEMVAVGPTKGTTQEDQWSDAAGKGGSPSPIQPSEGQTEGMASRRIDGKSQSGNHGAKDNWAQVLEVVHQRKTTALAPEHLDNLWAKGRNYKKREATKPGTNNNNKSEASTPKEQTISHPLAVEPPVPQTKSKPSEVDPKKTTELMELRLAQNSAESNALQSESSILQDEWDASKMLETAAPHTKRSLSIGGELDGWQALAHPEDGIPSLLRAGDGPGLGPGFDQDFAQRKKKGKQQSSFEGSEKLSAASQPSCKHLQVDVVGAHFEKGSSKTFAVYSIFVTDLQFRTWEVQRRFRNFEQLHRSLKDKPYYNLCLPAKRFLSSNLDNSFIRQRCALLDKYLKDLLAIPSIAELHEVWDFLSANSQNYAFGESPSMFKTLTTNVDDAVDDMFRQFRGVSDVKPAPPSSASEARKQIMGSTSIPSSTNQLHVLTNSSSTNRLALDKKGVPQNTWEEEEAESTHDGIPQHLPLGWHQEFDFQHAGSFNNGPFGPDPGLVDLHRDSKTFDGSKSSEGLSPVGSLTGSDTAEDDILAIPQDWGPPKVSVPLLNLVDVIFELQGRGWIRRQVFWMAKQVLQLGMGDAIDDFLLGKIQELRREEVVAGGIRWLHRILWPDGIFLTKHPSRQAKNIGSFEHRLEAARRAGLVREIILDRAPAALVSLIGRKQYQRCATDLYFFLQSAVCLKQLTYSLLELLLLSAFPELQDVVLEVRNM